MFKTSGACAAFLANYDTKSSAKVTFGNGQYDLPPWSISILPDCKTEVFNTARVKTILLAMSNIWFFILFYFFLKKENNSTEGRLAWFWALFSNDGMEGEIIYAEMNLSLTYFS